MKEIEKIYRKHLERFGAFFIDWFLIITTNVLALNMIKLFYKTNDIDDLFVIGIGIIYFIYFTFSTAKYGQTLGKKILKLKVVNQKGNDPITLTTAVYRHMPLALLFIVSFFIPSVKDQETSNILIIICKNIPTIWLALEIIIYLIKDNGQMFHDYLAKTTVIKVI